jgi:ankyrin repeat protein
VNYHPPTRKLAERPDLDQIKRQAKELLEAFRQGAVEARAEVTVHYRDADLTSFALHDAQLVIARSYGFDSWPKLKSYVNGVTAKRLADAVRAGDTDLVGAMLKARPELVNTDRAENDEHRAIHYAVLGRSPHMVRLLMQHGADARKGIYPHRDATTALRLAIERGYDGIAAIIREEEQNRRAALSGVHTVATASPDELTDLIIRGENAAALAMLEAEPALIAGCNRGGWSALHVASAMRNVELVSWLLEHGANPNQLGRGGKAPLDHAVGKRSADREQFVNVARLLLDRGAELTARSAVALGDAAWLKARHAEGALTNQIEDTGGLLSIAVRHDRLQILRLLLDLGFDPNERVRLEDLDEPQYSQCMPLWHAAALGKYGMAELLLQRGADPNGHVYASGTAVYSAYSRRDSKMVELLKRYGGVVDGVTLAHYRETGMARQLLENGATESEVEGMLWGAACGGDPEIVRMALERITWSRHDERWYWVLSQPLRMWNHMNGPWAHQELDRSTYVDCFRLVLERCDPNLRHARFGRTMLHDVAALDPHVTEEEGEAFARLLLDAGARMDERDDVLKSTPLGWACRWGRLSVARLLLARGADPVEEDAEAWARPIAWAEKMGHDDILAMLADPGSTSRERHSSR